MADVSPAVIKKTQDILGKYVKKPQLSEKLLRKPPFRFLHDVINAVIQETGFLDGLYTPDELISDNVKEKNAKIEYLQKLIDTVKIATKENLKAKPSKIVAGQEPEKTNELLQAIGKALDKKLNSTDAVEKVRNAGITSTKNITSPTNQRTKATKSTIKSDTPSNKPTSKLPPTTKSTSHGKSTIPNNKSQISQQNSIDKSSSIKEKPKKVKEELNGTKPKTKGHSRENSKATSKGKSAELIASKPKDNIDANNATIIDTNATIVQEEPTLSKTLTAEKPLSAELPKDPLGEEILVEDKDNPIESNSSNHSAKKLTENNNKTNPTNLKGTSSGSEQQQKIPTSFSAELVDIIDQEAELRRKEKLEKKSARHKTRPKLSKDEDNNNKLETSNDQVIQSSTNADLQATTSEGVGNESSSTLSELNTIIRNKSFIKDKDDNGTPSRPRTSLRPPSVRPASARPGAPRRRDKNVEIILQPEETIKMAGIDVKINSLNEELDDDGENLIIIEDATVNQDEIIHFSNHKNGSTQKSNDVSFDGVAQQGHLVQQILETQKELSKIDLGETDKKTELDWDATTLRQRQSSAKQMDALRDSIQKLTRSVNPLGKLMDFLQEDIDSMQLEMTMWHNVYTTATSDFKKEQGLTQSSIESLKHELSKIEANIKEQIEITNTSRVNILQNEEKILKLLNEI